MPALPQHQSGEPSQRERLFLRGGAADATHQQKLSLPELGQTQFIHRDGCVIRRRPRVLQENHIARGVCRHAESGAAVAEQEHERRVGLEAKELAPAQPHRFRPQTGLAQPCDERGRGRYVLSRKRAEIAAVEFDAVETRRGHHAVEPPLHGVGR